MSKYMSLDISIVNMLSNILGHQGLAGNLLRSAELAFGKGRQSHETKSFEERS